MAEEHRSSLLRDGRKWFRRCTCGWPTKSYVKASTSDKHMRRHQAAVRKLKAVDGLEDD